MAGKKITELPELGTTPAADDWLVIVDTSDTSESAEGTTKKVLKSDAIPAGGVQSVTGDLVNNSDPVNPIINRPTIWNWVGLVSQTGTSDPTIVAEFENNMGVNVVTFVRNSSGYFGIKTTQGGLDTDLFTAANTFVSITAGGSTYDDCFVVVNSIVSWKINFYNYGNGGGFQDEFTNMNIEIRVYA